MGQRGRFTTTYEKDIRESPVAHGTKIRSGLRDRRGQALKRMRHLLVSCLRARKFLIKHLGQASLGGAKALPLCQPEHALAKDHRHSFIATYVIADSSQTGAGIR